MSPDTEEKLRELSVYPEDGQVIITRRITESRSMIKVNGEICTAAAIKKAASLLLDIHGQHEHQSLLYPDRQMEILDEYSQSRSAEKKKQSKFFTVLTAVFARNWRLMRLMRSKGAEKSAFWNMKFRKSKMQSYGTGKMRSWKGCIGS